MTVDQFAAALASLIAEARRGDLADELLIIALQEALATLADGP